MSKILSISNKLLSLRGKVIITDEFDKQAYEGRGEFAPLSPTWRLTKGATQVATIRRKVFAWTPTWEICSEFGDFAIKRKLFSWTRQYYASGGEYDKAFIKGNIWDLNFEIRHDANVLAKAHRKILTLRDRHNIEIPEQNDQKELFVVISMMVLQLDRRSESEKSEYGELN